jgi:hypothetical protein
VWCTSRRRRAAGRRSWCARGSTRRVLAIAPRDAAEPVRVVGIDYDRLQARAYDTVLDYLRRHAREHLAEVAADYAVLRPSRTVADQIEWFTSHPDKRGLVERARAVEKLIADLSSRTGTR